MATILIVEDEEPLRSLLSVVFKEAGYDVREAIHGRQAIALLEHELPDLVITDAMMPLLNGIELCQRIKAGVETASIPVILMSAAGPRVMDGSGADAFLEKPFDLNELEELVKRLLTH